MLGKSSELNIITFADILKPQETSIRCIDGLCKNVLKAIYERETLGC